MVWVDDLVANLEVADVFDVVLEDSVNIGLV
jgi:hypothetical protein